MPPRIPSSFLMALLGRVPGGVPFDRNNQQGATYGIQGDEDRRWAMEHPRGYGSVDAPSPWGYNRDVFMAEHPNYGGGYYNPTSGRYDAPVEVMRGGFGEGYGTTPGMASINPNAVGLGSGRSWADPMAGLPTGGDTSSGTDWGGSYSSPGSSPAMASVPSGGDTGGSWQQEPSSQDFQNFLDALATMTTQENYA